MEIKTKYEFWQMVYLITDKAQTPRMIVGINITPTSCLYILSCGIDSSTHYSNEFKIIEPHKNIKGLANDNA